MSSTRKRSKGSTPQHISNRSNASLSNHSHASHLSNLLLAILLVLPTLVAYSNCFSSPFVLDDEDAVVTNQTIRSLSPVSHTLSGPLQSSTAGRPLANVSFALNYAVGGLDPRGYHAVNLIVHIRVGL